MILNEGQSPESSITSVFSAWPDLGVVHRHYGAMIKGKHIKLLRPKVVLGLCYQRESLGLDGKPMRLVLYPAQKVPLGNFFFIKRHFCQNNC